VRDSLLGTKSDVNTNSTQLDKAIVKANKEESAKEDEFLKEKMKKSIEEKK
jgi:hypothetical protein